MARRNVALFFYSGVIASAVVKDIEAYYAKGGYTVNFRKVPDNYMPKKDIVEYDWKIIGGDIPSTYNVFGTDPTYIIDKSTMSTISSGTATPPTATPDDILTGKTTASGRYVPEIADGLDNRETDDAPNNIADNGIAPKRLVDTPIPSPNAKTKTAETKTTSDTSVKAPT